MCIYIYIHVCIVWAIDHMLPYSSHISQLSLELCNLQGFGLDAAKSWSRRLKKSCSCSNFTGGDGLGHYLAIFSTIQLDPSMSKHIQTYQQISVSCGFPEKWSAPVVAQLFLDDLWNWRPPQKKRKMLPDSPGSPVQC